jgi:hypothetical protein
LTSRRFIIDDKPTVIADNLTSDDIRFQVITATFFTLFHHFFVLLVSFCYNMIKSGREVDKLVGRPERHAGV